MSILIKPYDEAAKLITDTLSGALRQGPVLLLLSGGSATTVYNELAASLELDLEPGELVVGLVDERYDLDPNHSNSNDAAIQATGLITRFEQLGAIYSPILHGHSLEDEAAQYNYQLTQFIFHEGRQFIAILGIGPDGHTAGILPDPDTQEFTKTFEGTKLIIGYDNDGPFPERITTTLTGMRTIDQAIVLVKDAAKISVVNRATDSDNPQPFHLLPATIIQEIPKVIIAMPNKETQ